MENPQTHKLRRCLICNKTTIFTSTLSPKGYWVCGQCGYRIKQKPFKFIKTKNGFKFKEAKPKKPKPEKIDYLKMDYLQNEILKNEMQILEEMQTL